MESENPNELGQGISASARQRQTDFEYNHHVLPRNLRPIRLSRRAEPFDSADFIYELKIDGFRALAYVEL